MESASHVYTAEFYLVAADRKLTETGWERGDDGQRIYLYLFFKTFLISGIITFICLLLAFPVAHLLATLPMAKSSLLMILVLLAVLDLASGADHQLDRAFAGTGGGE